MSVKDFIDKETFLANLEYELICDLVRLRKEKKYTQKQLAEEANMIRETITKIENQIISPQIKTLIKLLEPLGYTLKIEKIDNIKKE